MEEGNYCISTFTPFSNLFVTKNLTKVKNRVFKKALASVIIIDGGLGLGKTTTAVQMASYINGSPINLKKQLALGGGDLIDKLLTCQEEGLHVLIYDEASDFNRRGALSKFNADLNKVFDVCRAFKVIIIMVLPSVKVIDNDLFNKGIVRFLFHVADKGITCNLCWAYSAYRVGYLIRDLKDTKKNPIPGKCYIKTHPNFDFRVYDLTKERAKELDRVSTGAKLDVLRSTTVRLGGLMNYSQIAEALGMSKEWARSTVKKNNILASKRYKKINYFEADIVERLRIHIKHKRNALNYK